MKKKWVLGIGCFYVLVPTVLFFLGWVKTGIAVPICLLLVWFLKRVMESDVEMFLPVWNRTNIIRGIVIFMLIAVWVYFSGIGNFVWQNSDHAARNGLYEMLVANEWPVVKSVVCKDGVQTRGMIYYMGFWLPAAVTGKIFGVSAGYLFQYLWAVLGIFLSAVLVNSFLKTWAIWPVMLFVLFSGLDAMGCIAAGTPDPVFSFVHLEAWNDYQFSSFTTQLYWVFNQAVYAWILFALVMMQKSNRYIIWIWMLGLITCTFPFVGMMPFVVYAIFRNGKTDRADRVERQAGILNGLLSVENIFGGGIGIIVFLYLAGNLSVKDSATPAASAFCIQNAGENGYRLIGYAVFMLLEIGVYYIYVYRRCRRNRLFYISLIFLLVCPFIRVGSGIDFCMRASIPSLLVLYYMVADNLQKDMAERNIRCYVMIIILAVGSINVVHEIGRSVNNTAQQYRRYHEVINQTASEERMLQANNFSGEVDDSFFFKYLARE